MSLEVLAMWSQIAGAVAFLIVAILLWQKLMAPAVAAYAAAKNAEIAAAEERRAKMQADLEGAQAELGRGESDARTIVERAREEAERERRVALEAAAAEAERIRRNAEGERDRARLAATDALRIEFIEKALAKARVEAVKRVDGAVNARLVAATVDDMTKGKG